MSWVLDNIDLIWSLSLDHLRQSLIAIVLGFAIAVPIGWAAFRYSAVRGPTLATVGLLYTIPSLGLFAVLAAAFGIPLLSETNLIVALTIYAVAIMTRSVTDGLASNVVTKSTLTMGLASKEVSPVGRSHSRSCQFRTWHMAIPALSPLIAMSPWIA